MKITSYKLKNGQKRYRVKGRLGTDALTGKSKSVTRQGFKTQKEAESAFRQLQYDFDNGQLEPSNNFTYQEIYDRWVVNYKESVKESTYNKTTRIFKNHILPVFGPIKIKNISPISCQDFINDLMKKIKNGKSYYGYASTVMDYAKKLGLVRVNPFENVIIPRQRQTERQVDFLNREEVRQLLDAMDDNILHYAYFRLLIFTGLRKSEALALTWDDVNFFKKELSVNKTLSLGIGNQIIIQEPKTNENRTLVLDPDTIIALEKIRHITGGNLVFGHDNGTHFHPNRPGRWLKKYLEKAGLRHIRVHDLRHTHASLLFESGADIKAVQDRLGHRDIGTTMNIYAHVTENRAKETVLKFADYIG